MCAFYVAISYLVRKMYQALYGSGHRFHHIRNAQILSCAHCSVGFKGRYVIILPQKTRFVKSRYFYGICVSVGHPGIATHPSDKCREEQHYGSDARERSAVAGASLYVPTSDFPPVFRAQDRLGESAFGRSAFGASFGRRRLMRRCLQICRSTGTSRR